MSLWTTANKAIWKPAGCSRARIAEISFGYIQQQQRRIAEQERILSEINEINRLLITRYQEHEDLEADLDDEENSKSSNWSNNLKIYAWNMR